MRQTAFIWVAIIGLIGLICYAQLESILNPPGMTQNRAKYLRLITELGDEFDSTPIKDQAQFNAQAMERLSQFEPTTKGTAGSVARVKLILTQSLNPRAEPDFGQLTAEVDDIKELKDRKRVGEVRKKLNDALRKLYSAKSLTHSQADEISREIRSYSTPGWPYNLALRRAQELVGAPDKNVQKVSFANLVNLSFLFGGIFCWTIYLSARARNQLKPIGVPLKDAPRENGDSFGARFFVYLFAIVTLPSFFGPALVPVIGETWGKPTAGWIANVLCLILVVSPFFSVPSSFATIGISRKNLGLNFLWGFGGFMANMPILVLAAALGNTFLRWIPTSEHPAIQSLSNPGLVVPTVISAVLVAAIVEEVFFRGCLFQGILIRLKSPAWAILLSSLAFAAVHPQGGGAWLGLGFIGAMGGMLFHQTGSLIPAIVMHGLNNLFALAVALTAS